jgi:hypothetical protein
VRFLEADDLDVEPVELAAQQEDAIECDAGEHVEMASDLEQGWRPPGTRSR